MEAANESAGRSRTSKAPHGRPAAIRKEWLKGARELTYFQKVVEEIARTSSDIETDLLEAEALSDNETIESIRGLVALCMDFQCARVGMQYVKPDDQKSIDLFFPRLFQEADNNGPDAFWEQVQTSVALVEHTLKPKLTLEKVT